MICECSYLANIKNRLRGHWEVSGSISSIDGTEDYHEDCLPHLEGLTRLMMPCAVCFFPSWRMAAILLWDLTLHLNCYCKQLTGAPGPTHQTAGRWTTAVCGGGVQLKHTFMDSKDDWEKRVSISDSHNIHMDHDRLVLGVSASWKYPNGFLKKKNPLVPGQTIHLS